MAMLPIEHPIRSYSLSFPSKSRLRKLLNIVIDDMFLRPQASALLSLAKAASSSSWTSGSWKAWLVMWFLGFPCYFLDY